MWSNIYFFYGNIIHSASTKKGTSGSPIIRRSKENNIIGLHYGGYKKVNNIDFSFNIATIFDYILNGIVINKPNEINCIYIVKNNEKEIQLLHNYNLNINNWSEEYKKLYLNAKEINKKLFEENIEIYLKPLIIISSQF